MAAGGKCENCLMFGSTTRCTKCQTLHCPSCVSEHMQDKEDKHQFENITVLCKEHAKFKSSCVYYCKTCKTPVCVYCMVHKHAGEEHPLITIETIWKSKQEEITKYEAKKAEIEKQELDLSSVQKDISEEFSDRFGKQLIKSVEKTVENAKKKLKDHLQNRQQEKIRNRRSALQKAKEKLTNNFKEIKQFGSGDIISFTATDEQWKIPELDEDNVPTIDDYVKIVFSSEISKLKNDIDECFKKTFTQFYEPHALDKKICLAESSVTHRIVEIEGLWDVVCDRKERIICTTKNDLTLFVVSKDDTVDTKRYKTGLNTEYIAISFEWNDIFFSCSKQVLRVSIDDICSDVYVPPIVFYKAPNDWNVNGITVGVHNCLFLCLYRTLDKKCEGQILKIIGNNQKFEEYRELKWQGNSRRFSLVQPLYVSENKISGNICVSDNMERVVSISVDKTVKFEYKGKPGLTGSFEPRGIACNRRGEWLISDFCGNCVHCIDNDGNLLCYIGSGNLFKPTGIYFENGERAFITEYESGCIKVLEM